MPSLAKGCHELRIQDASRVWRIVYFVDPEAVVILEVFAKTTQRAPKGVLDASRARLRRYLSI
jgi:phage-related protein